MFKKIIHQFSLAALLTLTFLLTACGGGSSENSLSSNNTYSGRINYADGSTDLSGPATLLITGGVVSGSIQTSITFAGEVNPKIIFNGTVSSAGDLSAEVRLQGFLYLKLIGNVNAAAGKITGTVETYATGNPAPFTLSK
jgi:hypothetical protein